MQYFMLFPLMLADAFGFFIPGYWPTFENVKRNYTISTLGENTAKKLQDFIQSKKHSSVTNQNATEIFNAIIKTASKMGIDPLYLATLIYHESVNFKVKAQSETGAQGLGQITAPGIKEVLDQLTGSDARSENTHYFNQMARELGLDDEIVNLLQSIKCKSFAERNTLIKNALSKDLRLSVFFAAIHFKTLIAGQADSNPKGTVQSWHEQAYYKYNGSTTKRYDKETKSTLEERDIALREFRKKYQLIINLTTPGVSQVTAANPAPAPSPARRSGLATIEEENAKKSRSLGGQDSPPAKISPEAEGVSAITIKKGQELMFMKLENGKWTITGQRVEPAKATREYKRGQFVEIEIDGSVWFVIVGKEGRGAGIKAPAGYRVR